MIDLSHAVYWLLFGLIAICLEVLAPGISMLGTGLSALAIGLIAYFFPSIEVVWQLFIFSIFAVVFTWVCKKWISKSVDQSAQTRVNDIQKELIGFEFYIQGPIEHGKTRMQLRGTYWTLQGPDVAANTKVKIVKMLGNQLFVEPC